MLEAGDGNGAALGSGAQAPARCFAARFCGGGFVACTMNLTKAIVGAGMMGLPRPFRLLGGPFGSVLVLLVGALTFWSKAVLVAGTERHGGVPSSSSGSDHSSNNNNNTHEDRSGDDGATAPAAAAAEAAAAGSASTYAALTLAACGPRMASVLRASVLLFCFGFATVYLVVITDVLVGTPPACNGLICQITGAPPGSRRVVLLVLSGGVAAPLLLLRSIQRLNAFNYAGVAAALGLAAISAALAAAATARGLAHPLPKAPQWEELGGGGGLAGAGEVAGVVAVLLACYVAHQNIHPLLPMLQPYSGGRMRGVLAASLAIAAAVFWTLSVGSALAFGPDLKINVLSNMSIEAMSPLLGPRPAAAVSVAVQVGYSLSLLASLLLYLHPLRTALAETIWGSTNTGSVTGSGSGGGGRVAEKEAQHYYALTYGLLAAATGAAISVPDIWAALSAIGNLCASVEAFIVPGCIALSLQGLWPWAPEPHGSSNEISSGGPQPAAAGARGLAASSAGGGGGLRSNGGGGGSGGGEAAPLLLDAGSGRVPLSDAQESSFGQFQQQQGQRQRGGGGRGGFGSGSAISSHAGRWPRLAAAANAGMAVGAIALGFALLINGLIQEIVKWTHK